MSIITGHLFKLDFDNMENRDAVIKTKIASFVPSDNLNAYSKAANYIQSRRKVLSRLG